MAAGEQNRGLPGLGQGEAGEHDGPKGCSRVDLVPVRGS
jgi:hypothetical protein